MHKKCQSWSQANVVRSSRISSDHFKSHVTRILSRLYSGDHKVIKYATVKFFSNYFGWFNPTQSGRELRETLEMDWKLITVSQFRPITSTGEWVHELHADAGCNQSVVLGIARQSNDDQHVQLMSTRNGGCLVLSDCFTPRVDFLGVLSLRMLSLISLETFTLHSWKQFTQQKDHRRRFLLFSACSVGTGDSPFVKLFHLRTIAIDHSRSSHSENHHIGIFLQFRASEGVIH